MFIFFCVPLLSYLLPHHYLCCLYETECFQLKTQVYSSLTNLVVELCGETGFLEVQEVKTLSNLEED